MIYIDDHIWDFDLNEALNQVCPSRRDYALRYRQERDRRLSVVAYLLLQKALRLEYGIEELPEFSRNANGKPLLKGYPDIHFSLSHCHEVVACVLSDKLVGVDIETLDQYDEEVARRVMNDNEMSQILTSSSPAVTFTRLWTMKESFFKMTGGPLNGDVADILDLATSCHFTTIHHPAYILTTCTTK
ncbi:MAG: 4'-phosphopantetheinyl transferase superfamily protein [Muribaculaceae bacterium]|nr:4'-phosphopantetheinyl transferase superfamily protein [Muribaculaceae bacterium]